MGYCTSPDLTLAAQSSNCSYRTRSGLTWSGHTFMGHRARQVLLTFLQVDVMIHSPIVLWFVRVLQYPKSGRCMQLSVKVPVNCVYAVPSALFSFAKQMLPDSVKCLLPLLRNMTTSEDGPVLNSTSGKIRHYLGVD
jgi:ABC-type sulfate transport system permease subunit